MSKIKNIIIKAGLVVSLSLVSFVGLATKITGENFTAISNELGQSTHKIINKTDQMIYNTDFESLGGENGVIESGKKLVKEIQGEGTVLLQNDNNALPLKKGSKVSLFGMTSVGISVGGRGSAHAPNPLPATSLREGLEKAGLEVNDDLYKYYEKANNSSTGPVYRQSDMPFYTLPRGDKDNIPLASNKEVLDTIKTYGDSAIYVIKRIGGEASDIPGSYDEESNTVKGDKLVLHKNEKSILKGLADLKEKGVIKKIIVLLNSTNQIAQKEFAPEYGIDAMLWVGHVGITGTEAIGEILVGDQNPSGHLVDTFYYDHKDNPVMRNYGAYKYTNRDSFASQLLGDSSTDGYGTYVAYQEGIYLGYRYSETRYTDVVNKVPNAGSFDYNKVISAPFGYGLSYTNFEFSNFKAVEDGDNFNISVDVKNIGDKYSGKDVVQIYLQKPFNDYDKANGIEKAAVELVGYAKTKVLAPGETQNVSVVVSEETFRTYDANKAKTYILSEGEYLLTAAHDAHQAANNFLAKAGKTTKDGMTENGDAKLVKGFSRKFNAEKYSKSRATDATIHNLFDANNYNNIPGMEGKLEFRSRTNWSKELNNKLEMNQYMVDEINRQQNSNSIQKDNNAYPTYGAENNLQLIQLLKDEEGNEIAYDSKLWDDFLDQLTWDETVNLLSVGLRTTQAYITLGKPKTLDHNGPTGLTERYNKSSEGLAAIKGDKDGNASPVYYPSIPVLAATYNKDIARKFGNMLGEDALWAGYNGLYGIGLNTHRSPYAGRQFEYFSEDPFLAGTMATEEVIGLQAKGCMAYIKHFALNDQETQRFGVQVWSNEQALREISLRPYEYAVIDGNAMNAMASFSRIGLEFAPASRNLLTNYLRGELGMKGLVVTDMYTLGYVQEQYPQFLMAGTDIPDGELKPEVFNQFKTNYSSVAWQMREAAKRIMYNTVRSNAMNGFDINTRVVTVTPPWKVAVNSAMIATSVLFAGFAIWAAVEMTLYYKRKSR